MCLRKCFAVDGCAKELPGDVWFNADKQVLVHLSPGKTESRSFFAGDATWSKLPNGRWEVRESHTIELILMQSLLQGKRNVPFLLHQVQAQLNNAHIYYILVYARLRGLERHGFVSQDRTANWKITPTGIHQLASVASRRLLSTTS